MKQHSGKEKGTILVVILFIASAIAALAAISSSRSPWPTTRPTPSSSWR